jgi:hypothetical protein
MTSPLNTASSLLCWSNVLYVVGAILTLGTSALVLFEKRLAGKGVEIKHSVRNEVFFVASAVICLAGTCGAIYFGGRVSDIKDADLAAYKKTADGQIAQANKDAAKALSDAATANQKAGETTQANLKLQLELGRHESVEKKTDADLAAATQKLDQFTQGLAQQQQGIAQKVQAPVSLNQNQVQILGNALKPFAGQEVTLRMTMDSTSARFANQIGQAFSIAGIKTGAGTATYAGATYQGVSVVIQKVDGHPPIADTLLREFLLLGIPAQGVLEPSFPPNSVTICIGPQ